MELNALTGASTMEPNVLTGRSNGVRSQTLNIKRIFGSLEPTGCSLTIII